MPNTDRMAAPATANSASTAKPMTLARIATWPRSARFMPAVSARNSGASPGGSTVTRRVTKALNMASKPGITGSRSVGFGSFSKS